MNNDSGFSLPEERSQGLEDLKLEGVGRGTGNYHPKGHLEALVLVQL